MHREQKICKHFVVPGNSPAALGKPDIDNLGVLTITFKTIGRQLSSNDNSDNKKIKLSI